MAAKKAIVKATFELQRSHVFEKRSNGLNALYLGNKKGSVTRSKKRIHT